MENVNNGPFLQVALYKDDIPTKSYFFNTDLQTAEEFFMDSHEVAHVYMSSVYMGFAQSEEELLDLINRIHKAHG